MLLQIDTQHIYLLLQISLSITTLSLNCLIHTAPRNCKIDIYTDSQSVIYKYQKLTQTTINPSHSYSYNCWPIWHTILNLIKSYKLSITFHKVLAHSNDDLNEAANTLAQNHQTLLFLEFKYTNLYNPNFYIICKNFNIKQSTRKLIKTICNAHIIAMWSS